MTPRFLALLTINLFGRTIGFGLSNSLLTSKYHVVPSFASPVPRKHPNIQETSIFSSITDSSEETASVSPERTTNSDFETIKKNMLLLESGSDIRGTFVNHPDLTIASAVEAIYQMPNGSPAPLTPLVAYCVGYSFAKIVSSSLDGKIPRICVGRDPRDHGPRLLDHVCMGAEAFGSNVKDTGQATTPSIMEFCRADLCDGGIIVTASHLPKDRNGCKFYTKSGGFTKNDVKELIEGAIECAMNLSSQTQLPSIGQGSIEHVDYMPHYASTLRDAIIREVNEGLSPDQSKSTTNDDLPLAGLKIILNAGKGAGGFFNKVLADLGADVSSSIGTQPDSTFPLGVPNPEASCMVQETKQACEQSNANIGVMLDTDADRSGFIVPRTVLPDSFSDYEPLNRNRLIALLAVIFSKSSPGCAIVTDSVTSEGLEKFLEQDLSLSHVRYLKGYANVIGKAKELTESGKANAEVAIETSGHCAMKENGYLDDGTYTAVKVISCLAKLARDNEEPLSLLDLIADLEEMEEEEELRIPVRDGSLESTNKVYEEVVKMIEQKCQEPQNVWKFDPVNLEGARARTGNGGFFQFRKSLHDPVVSLQVESRSKDEARSKVIKPIVDLLQEEKWISDLLDLQALQNYLGPRQMP